MTDHYSSVEVVAEAWASIDGKLEQFRAEKAMSRDDALRNTDGYYDGYMADAAELLKRIRARHYVLVEAGEEPVIP